MSVLCIEDREVEDFLLYQEEDRWLRVRRELEVVSNTLRNSPGKMATKEGEELLDSLSDEIDTRLSEVISRLKTIERAE